MPQASNEGETGPESIRVNGVRVQDLPLGLGEIAKQQIPLAMDIHRQNKVNNILKRYPTQKVDYLESRVREARENMVRVKTLKTKCQEDIRDYNSLIKEVEGKPFLGDLDDEIQEIGMGSGTLEEKKAKIHALKEGTTPHKVSALKQQISQFEDSIERCDGVIQQENDTIAELSVLIGSCTMRDLELRAVGAAKG